MTLRRARPYWSGKKQVVSNDFVATFNTANTSAGSSASNQVALPLQSDGAYDFTVDWGDGNEDNITVWNQSEVTHTYASSGTYTVTISGQCEGWMFAASGDRLKILDLQSWGPVHFRSGVGNSGCFQSCSNLDVSATDTPTFFHNGSLQNFFFGCTSLVGNASFSDWDTTGQTVLINTFRSCPNFNAPLNGWDVSSVTSFSGTFLLASAFNQDLDLWNTSSGTTFAGMFQQAGSFNGDVTTWVMTSATNVGGMFMLATVFNQDITGWDVSNVVTFGGNFNGMFRRATAFNQNIGLWDVSSGQVFDMMFEGPGDFDQSLAGWSPTAMTAAVNFLNGKTLSTSNYDATLIAWDGLALQNNVNFHAGGSQYSAGAAATARQNIIDNHTWTITDGGQA